jgi:hypothetical protein
MDMGDGHAELGSFAVGGVVVDASLSHLATVIPPC